MYDIIIIGAGPAGLTAALYALRANKKVLLFEAKSPGGQILNASKVENYPAIKFITGYDYSNALYEQVKEHGGEFIFDTVVKVEENKTVYTKDNEYKAKAIIIATGAYHKKLNIEGEEDFVGKGLSYCATCDGNFYKDKDVAVVGGGNTALEDAIYLSNIAKKVYIIHRRDTFKGEHKYLDELRGKDNLEFILNSNVTKIIGNDVLEAIEVTNALDVKRNIEISGLFIAVGQEPNNKMFSNILELDDYGYVIAKNEVHTSIPGIYIAGDARVKELRQLTTAVSDGSIAATVAIKEMEDE